MNIINRLPIFVTVYCDLGGKDGLNRRSLTRFLNSAEAAHTAAWATIGRKRHYSCQDKICH
jgi:hypothetical protein